MTYNHGCSSNTLQFWTGVIVQLYGGEFHKLKPEKEKFAEEVAGMKIEFARATKEAVKSYGKKILLILGCFFMGRVLFVVVLVFIEYLLGEFISLKIMLHWWIVGCKDVLNSYFGYQWRIYLSS